MCSLTAAMLSVFVCAVYVSHISHCKYNFIAYLANLHWDLKVSVKS